MRDRSRQLNMPHAFTANFGTRNFNSATIADNAFITDTLIFTAMALPIARRAEYALAEKPVALWFQRTIIDGFRLLYFAIRPFANLFRRCKTNPHGIKIIYIQQGAALPSYSSAFSSV